MCYAFIFLVGLVGKQQPEQTNYKENNQGNDGVAHAAGESFYKTEAEKTDYDGYFLRHVIKAEKRSGVFSFGHQLGISTAAD